MSKLQLCPPFLRTFFEESEGFRDLYQSKHSQVSLYAVVSKGHHMEAAVHWCFEVEHPHLGSRLEFWSSVYAEELTLLKLETVASLPVETSVWGEGEEKVWVHDAGVSIHTGFECAMTPEDCYVYFQGTEFANAFELRDHSFTSAPRMKTDLTPSNV
jgi:hypothetical protein